MKTIIDMAMSYVTSTELKRKGVAAPHHGTPELQLCFADYLNKSFKSHLCFADCDWCVKAFAKFFTNWFSLE